nr:S24 family peptidase [Moraxella bovoculi]
MALVCDGAVVMTLGFNNRMGETESDMYLKPLNPDWPEQKILPMGECRLVGKVVGKWVRY